MERPKIIIRMVLLMLVLLCSCKDKKVTQSQKEPAKTEKDELGTFVYFDQAWVLHTKNGCKAVYKDHNMQEVRPVRIYEVTRKNLKRVCSQCVTEDHLLEMEGILDAIDAGAIFADSAAAEDDYDTEESEYSWDE